MNFEGILLGAGAFLCIGLFHPLVIKAEYYFGVKSWWAFLIVGLLAAGGSLFVENTYISIFLALVVWCDTSPAEAPAARTEAPRVAKGSGRVAS